MLQREDDDFGRSLLLVSSVYGCSLSQDIARLLCWYWNNRPKMATWGAAGSTGGTTPQPPPSTLLMMRKDHQPPGHPDSGLVAMLSSAGLRGLDRSPPPITGCKRPLYTAMLDSLDESGDGEVADDGSTGGGGGYSEKKRRLSAEQVRSLEMSFEMENRLEPVRKMQLAQELGLQPRQVAVWFQNRRARWKTKQLERDYEILKAAYESVAEENKKLKAQLHKLSDIDDNVLMKTDDDEEQAEESGAGARKVNHVPGLENIKSSGVEDDETCTSPDSPTSKFKESPSSDGYGSEVLDTLSPHAPPTMPPAVLPTEEAPLAVKEEPVIFPYKLEVVDDALRGLEDEASYSCLFGAGAGEDPQANWAWWE